MKRFMMGALAIAIIPFATQNVDAQSWSWYAHNNHARHHDDLDHREFHRYLYHNEAHRYPMTWNQHGRLHDQLDHSRYHDYLEHRSAHRSGAYYPQYRYYNYGRYGHYGRGIRIGSGGIWIRF